ncbi:MAG: hypothetical protein ACOC1F_07040 [Myxococcota bacterium]
MARAAAEQRSSLEPGEMEEAAQRVRERARARENSARLLLEHIHDLYDIARNKKQFIDQLRRQTSLLAYCETMKQTTSRLWATVQCRRFARWSVK